MSSPVLAFFETIEIQQDSTQAIYIQIAQQITDAIQRSILPIGCKLPGSRQLAATIGVHRKTVVAAFEELELQNWVKIYPNKGTYVIEDNLQKSPLKFNYADKKHKQEPTFTFAQTHLFDLPQHPNKTERFFTDGTADVRINAAKEWHKYFAEFSRKKIIRNTYHWYFPDSESKLLTQLTNYLNVTRGLRISPENVLVTQNASVGLYLLMEVLLDKNDTVVVAEKNYYKANMIFQKNKTKLQSIPIDEEGIDVDGLEKICQKKNIRAVYVMPHAHYPTTVSLSKTRRLQLLKLAQQYGFMIIEDDWDYDLQYEKMSSLPLCSADDEGRVIYVGEIGKNLLPGSQIGFMVGPEKLISALRQYAQIFGQSDNHLKQMTISAMLEEGEIQKHLKKSKKIYKQRRDKFAQLIQDEFADEFSFSLPHGGLAFWLQCQKPSVNLLQVNKKCLSNGLYIPTSLLYQNKNNSAIRLGFGHMNEQEVQDNLQILKACL